MAKKRVQCKVLLTLFLIINTCFAVVLMEGDSLLVRENAHIEKLLMLDVTNEATEADSILVKATDNYICNFPILKLPFFTESEIDSILLGKADTGHVHDTADVNNLSLYLGQKLDVSDSSDLARKVHDHTISDVTGLQDALNLKLDVTELNNYYTKTNLQTSGQSQVHANNITNVPWLTSLPSHDHDTRYPLKSLGRVSPGYTYDAMETDRVTLADGMYTYSWYSNTLNRPADCTYGAALTFGGHGGTHGKAQLLIGWYGSNENYIGFRSLRNVTDPWSSIKRIFHEGYKPQWGDIGSKPTVFSPEDHNHDTSDVTNLSLYLGQKLDVSDTSDLARKIHVHTISDVTGLQDTLELKL